MTEADVAVIGGGMAGVSVAAELAAHVRVVLVEMEAQPGRHSTGRSAAIFAPSYGPAPIRALTRASAGFLNAPPDAFAPVALTGPRPLLLIARPDQTDALDRVTRTMAAEAAVSRLDAAATRDAQPLLRDGYAAGGMLDEAGRDIDVAALQAGYLRRLRAAGGTVLTGAAVEAMARDGAGWRIETRAGTVRAGLVVNAAGAWADVLGAMAGAERIGLVPKRRTAVIVAAPAGIETRALPITIDVDERFYLKPDAGRLLLSPADATPADPGDAQPEELDVAICIDRCQTAFALDVRRIEARWAGLRSFVADGVPVIGFSDAAPGFFWLAGQGGYGIQTAPAASRLAAALALGRGVPGDVADHGFDAASVAPSRLNAEALP